MSQSGDTFGREWKPPASATTSPWLLGLLLVLFTVLLVRSFTGTRPAAGPILIPEPVPRGDLDGKEQRTVDLFKTSRSSVVFIQTSEHTIEARRGYQFRLEESPRNLGTGFIWDKHGHIVTNFHVVTGASSATVLLSDGTAWTAQLVGASPENDIAVLRIEAGANKLQPLTLGTSSDLQVGQSVFALGYPFGLNLTLTSGLISGLGQTIPLENGAEIREAIQVDASINPGNSGGPLLDSAGRLIGMNTAIITRSHATSGFGFAIPIDTIRAEIEEMSRHPIRRLPILGIVPSAELATVTLRNTGERLQLGVPIVAVMPGGPADKAGLQGYYLSDWGIPLAGDIILEMDGQSIDRPEKVDEILSTFNPGDQIRLKILRGDRTLEIQIQLE